MIFLNLFYPSTVLFCRAVAVAVRFYKSSTKYKVPGWNLVRPQYMYIVIIFTRPTLFDITVRTRIPTATFLTVPLVAWIVFK